MNLTTDFDVQICTTDQYRTIPTLLTFERIESESDQNEAVLLVCCAALFIFIQLDSVRV